MELMDLINSLMPSILEAVMVLLGFIATVLGRKIGKYFDNLERSREIRAIVQSTVDYVENVAKHLEGEKKAELAKQKIIAYAEVKGLKVSEVEIDILIEHFHRHLNDAYSVINEPDIFEVVLEDEGAFGEVN